MSIWENLKFITKLQIRTKQLMNIRNCKAPTKKEKNERTKTKIFTDITSRAIVVPRIHCVENLSSCPSGTKYSNPKQTIANKPKTMTVNVEHSIASV